MIKKLIGFDETLIERIEKYANESNNTFTNAVRNLIDIGLYQVEEESSQNTIKPTEDEPDGIDLITLVKEVEKLKQQTEWFKADDTQSRLHNVEITMTELEKKVNVITVASKLFKKHIEDREIHLVDR